MEIEGNDVAYPTKYVSDLHICHCLCVYGNIPDIELIQQPVMFYRA